MARPGGYREPGTPYRHSVVPRSRDCPTDGDDAEHDRDAATHSDPPSTVRTGLPAPPLRNSHARDPLPIARIRVTCYETRPPTAPTDLIDQAGAGRCGVTSDLLHA